MADNRVDDGIHDFAGQVRRVRKLLFRIARSLFLKDGRFKDFFIQSRRMRQLISVRRVRPIDLFRANRPTVFEFLLFFERKDHLQFRSSFASLGAMSLVGNHCKPFALCRC